MNWLMSWTDLVAEIALALTVLYLLSRSRIRERWLARRLERTLDQLEDLYGVDEAHEAIARAADELTDDVDGPAEQVRRARGGPKPPGISHSGL